MAAQNPVVLAQESIFQKWKRAHFFLPGRKCANSSLYQKLVFWRSTRVSFGRIWIGRVDLLGPNSKTTRKENLPEIRPALTKKRYLSSRDTNHVRCARNHPSNFYQIFLDPRRIAWRPHAHGPVTGSRDTHPGKFRIFGLFFGAPGIGQIAIFSFKMTRKMWKSVHFYPRMTITTKQPRGCP
jgi:hypothetical protein